MTPTPRYSIRQFTLQHLDDPKLTRNAEGVTFLIKTKPTADDRELILNTLAEFLERKSKYYTPVHSHVFPHELFSKPYFNFTDSEIDTAIHAGRIPLACRGGRQLIPIDDNYIVDIMLGRVSITTLLTFRSVIHIIEALAKDKSLQGNSLSIREERKCVLTYNIINLSVLLYGSPDALSVTIEESSNIIITIGIPTLRISNSYNINNLPRLKLHLENTYTMELV